MAKHLFTLNSASSMAIAGLCRDARAAVVKALPGGKRAVEAARGGSGWVRIHCSPNGH